MADKNGGKKQNNSKPAVVVRTKPHDKYDRSNEVPQDLIDLLEEQKEENKNYDVARQRLAGNIDIDDDSEPMSTKNLDKAAAIRKDSNKDLADGQISMMPATCIDVLYDNRSIKNVSYKGAAN